MRIAVVILNWNGLHFLEKLLPEVVEHTLPDAEVYVADNGSSDGSVEWLRQNLPGVHVIDLQKNYGFAGGYNRALQQIEADYYVLLNSDVQVSQNWIKPVAKALEKDPEIAACQPKIRSFQDRKMFEYAGAAGGFMDKNGFIFCRGRMFNTFEPDNGQYDDEIEIFWASGCCLFVKAEFFHEVGGLDEDFFAHMEEIDLCWRLKNRGYKVKYIPGSTVFHIGGGTLSKINPRKTYLNFRNNLYILVKNYYGGNLSVKLFFRLILDGIASLKFLAEGSLAHSVAVMRAHGSFYRNIQKMRERRHKLREGPLRINPTGVYNRNVVFDYFLRGKHRFSDLKKGRFLKADPEKMKDGKPVRF